MQKVIFKFLLFPLLIGNLLNAQVTSTGNYTISKNNFDKISISFTTDNLKYELVQEEPIHILVYLWTAITLHEMSAIRYFSG